MNTDDEFEEQNEELYLMQLQEKEIQEGKIWLGFGFGVDAILIVWSVICYFC